MTEMTAADDEDDTRHGRRFADFFGHIDT